LLLAVYFIETGLVLVVAPWTEWWTRNFFAGLLPLVQRVMATSSVRLAVVGTGLVTIVAGLSEMRLLFQRRWSRGASAESRSPEL
jgi:hypothetical protein